MRKNAVFAILAAVAGGLLIFPAYAASPSAEYAYRIPVSIAASGGSVGDPQPLCLDYDPALLVSLGYVQETDGSLEDVRLDNLDGADVYALNTPDPCLWFNAENIGDGNTQTYSLYTGHPTDTRTPAFMLPDASASITVPHDSSLSVTSNLTLMVDALNVAALPSTDANVLTKQGNYKLIMQPDGTITYVADYNTPYAQGVLGASSSSYSSLSSYGLFRWEDRQDNEYGKKATPNAGILVSDSAVIYYDLITTPCYLYHSGGSGCYSSVYNAFTTGTDGLAPGEAFDRVEYAITSSAGAYSVACPVDFADGSITDRIVANYTTSGSTNTTVALIDPLDQPGGTSSQTITTTSITHFGGAPLMCKSNVWDQTDNASYGYVIWTHDDSYYNNGNNQTYAGFRANYPDSIGTTGSLGLCSKTINGTSYTGMQLHNVEWSPTENRWWYLQGTRSTYTNAGTSSWLVLSAGSLGAWNPSCPSNSANITYVRGDGTVCDTINDGRVYWYREQTDSDCGTAYSTTYWYETSGYAQKGWSRALAVNPNTGDMCLLTGGNPFSYYGYNIGLLYHDGASTSYDWTGMTVQSTYGGIYYKTAPFEDLYNVYIDNSNGYKTPSVTWDESKGAFFVLVRAASGTGVGNEIGFWTNCDVSGGSSTATFEGTMTVLSVETSTNGYSLNSSTSNALRMQPETVPIPATFMPFRASGDPDSLDYGMIFRFNRSYSVSGLYNNLFWVWAEEGSNEYDSSEIVAPGTDYDITVQVDATSVTLDVNGTVDAYTGLSDTYLTASNNPVTVGGFDSLVTLERVRIGDSSLLTPTWKLDLDAYADNLTLVDAGDAGDGWSWEYDVIDQSGNGNVGAWAFASDHTGLTITLGTLIPTAGLPAILVGATLADTIGGLPGLTGTSSGLNWPGYASINAAITQAGAVNSTLWFILLAGIGLIIGAAAVRFTNYAGIGLVIAAGWVGIGWPLGLFPVWVAVVGVLTLFGTGAAMALVNRR